MANEQSPVPEGYRVNASGYLEKQQSPVVSTVGFLFLVGFVVYLFATKAKF